MLSFGRTKMTHLLITIGLLFTTFVGQARGLNHVRVLVPDAALQGDFSTLQCHFDLEGDALYSVKWYKGRQEFYRYTPRETPPIKTFPIPGLSQLKVEVGKSNATQVTLREVAPAVSGRYSCEVSADAPSFQTALVTGQIDIVTPPKHRPSLQGLRSRYRPGDTLRVNCTSADSRPAANLSWSLNDHKVDRRYVKVYRVVRENEEDLETSSSILEKILSPKDFNSNSRLKVRCTASILSVFWQTTEKSAEWERYKELITDRQPSPSVLLNLKTDVETVSIAKDNEPTRVTAPASSASSTLLVLPSILCCRTLLFQYNFVLN